MTPFPLARRSRLVLVVPALLAVLLVSGCSEDPPPVDPGNVSSLQAGAADRLAAADVDVVALTSPASVTPEAVDAALKDAGLAPKAVSESTASESLSISADRLTGIPTLLGDLGAGDPFVVVVFAQPADAWVFAAGGPEVFSDTATESGRRAFLAGPVVGFASTAGSDSTAGDVRRALTSLAGTDATPSASPSASSSPESSS